MSWREFRVLVGGLGPQSLLAAVARSTTAGPKVLKGRAVDAYFATI